MDKRITPAKAAAMVKDGASVMVGGFLCCGTPDLVIDALAESDVKDLTLYTNDTGFVDRGVGKLVVKKKFRRIFASHIGTNKETGRQMMEGETEVNLVPQGTLAEQIRAGGFGLGGFLTPTGVGTEVEKGKQVMEINGKKYLLELPVRADFALIFADRADENGNLVFRGALRNFNPVMAAAADVTIAEVREIVPVGALDPNDVIIPGALVNYIVEAKTNG
ncbi:MAG: CoA transferase subunit A [Clostridiales bacterium]|nr:CoA transferase subunit A [Clostridiales bacterium]